MTSLIAITLLGDGPVVVTPCLDPQPVITPIERAVLNSNITHIRLILIPPEAPDADPMPRTTFDPDHLDGSCCRGQMWIPSVLGLSGRALMWTFSIVMLVYSYTKMRKNLLSKDLSPR
ncbi:hypothetical protein CRG98_024772 [Punica granatum]|uniref:Uncharacterized protein n=1 Tax=Punica granatum TaxID=22663 RepID=A0A2I0JEZ5_PUNGR|nr:hypothetical protein CRG98_024772 [Punica granatum]